MTGGWVQLEKTAKSGHPPAPYDRENRSSRNPGLDDANEYRLPLFVGDWTRWGSRMTRRGVVMRLILVSGLITGCRVSPLLNPYANVIDDVNDTHLYFDNWYNPRLDISRAGKPDWCSSPANSRLGRNICYLGCYDKHDDCNQYPPSNPYMFPSNTMPEPKVWTPASKQPTAPLASPTEMPPSPAPGPAETPPAPAKAE